MSFDRRLISVLEGCSAAGVRRFLFTSSAAVYGAPDVDLVTDRLAQHQLGGWCQTAPIRSQERIGQFAKR